MKTIQDIIFENDLPVNRETAGEFIELIMLNDECLSMIQTGPMTWLSMTKGFSGILTGMYSEGPEFPIRIIAVNAYLRSLSSGHVFTDIGKEAWDKMAEERMKHIEIAEINNKIRVTFKEAKHSTPPPYLEYTCMQKDIKGFMIISMDPETWHGKVPHHHINVYPDYPWRLNPIQTSFDNMTGAIMDKNVPHVSMNGGFLDLILEGSSLFEVRKEFFQQMVASVKDDSIVVDVVTIIRRKDDLGFILCALLTDGDYAIYAYHANTCYRYPMDKATEEQIAEITSYSRDAKDPHIMTTRVEHFHNILDYITLLKIGN